MVYGTLRLMCLALAPGGSVAYCRPVGLTPASMDVVMGMVLEQTEVGGWAGARVYVQSNDVQYGGLLARCLSMCGGALHLFIVLPSWALPVSQAQWG
jgi:hypothetical protein